MSSLFPALPAFLAQVAAPPAISLRGQLTELAQLLQGNAQAVALSLLLGQLVLIVAFWLSSKPVAEGRGTFGRALQTYFLYLLAKIGLLAVLVICALKIFGAANAAHYGQAGAGNGAIMIACGALMIVAAVLVFYVLFAVPMRVYRIDFGAALFFLIFVLVLWLAGNYAVERSLGAPLAQKSALLREWVVKHSQESRLLGAKGPATPEAEENPFAAAERRAADRSRSVLDRQGALKEIYDRLETMRQGLKPGDTAAIAEYNRRKDRYLQLLNDLQADVASRRGSEI